MTGRTRGGKEWTPTDVRQLERLAPCGASFLAGGEYPYPVVQPQAGGGYSVTIQFKEFGVRLNFTPNILGGDLIHLKLRPEVSALDFNNAIILQGFRIPALSTRKTETEVELQDGQTFAIAGLLSESVQATASKIPALGDLPILGALFSSTSYQRSNTELVVLVTPQLVEPLDPQRHGHCDERWM